MATTPEHKTYWFAARIVTGQKVYVLTMLGRDGVTNYVPNLFPSLLFLRAREEDLERMHGACYGKLIFYRDPLRQHPQPINEKQMRNFILVTSANPDDILKLDKIDSEFLRGERVRVLSGPFKGAEGVVKRIKGDRRLVVSIDGIAAVATCFIPPSMLEPVPAEM